MFRRLRIVGGRGPGAWLACGLVACLTLLAAVPPHAGAGLPDATLGHSPLPWAEPASPRAGPQVSPSAPLRTVTEEARTGPVYMPAVVRNYTPPRPAFGVQMWAVAEGGGLSKAIAAGVSWVRAAPFAWDAIEPERTSPPTYHWEAVDELSLLNASAANLQFMGLVQFTPPWAQATPPYACGPIRPDALDEFAEFLRALVERYGRAPYRVRYWELWNEPDIEPALVSPHSSYGCWGNGDPNDPYYGGESFAEMLKVAYPAIKAVDPQAQVAVGGLLLDCDPRFPPPGKDCRSSGFLQGILANGGGPYFDLVAFHAYTYGGLQGGWANPNWSDSPTAIPEKVSFLREVLAQYGYGEKELISTEVALRCSCAPEECGPCFETQAMYIPRAYVEAMALGLRSQIYFAMTNDTWGRTGLLYEQDLSEKPAYFAYDTAAAFLSAAEYVGPAVGYAPEIEAYAFDLRGRTGALDVIWSRDGTPQTVTLPEGSAAYDRYGHLIGPLTDILVDASPVYVVRP